MRKAPKNFDKDYNYYGISWEYNETTATLVPECGWDVYDLRKKLKENVGVETKKYFDINDLRIYINEERRKYDNFYNPKPIIENVNNGKKAKNNYSKKNNRKVNKIK
jgi:hypothetical protein